jgi:hypothetical protein
MANLLAAGGGRAATVDADVADAYGSLSWRPMAGRILATIGNRFYDLQSLLGGARAVVPDDNPTDLRRESLRELRFVPGHDGQPSFLSLDPLKRGRSLRSIEVPQPFDFSPYTVEGETGRFMPLDAAEDTPNIAIDSLDNRATVLALSHWPGNRTPRPYKADLSAESVFLALDALGTLPSPVMVSDHFDVDGLIGVAAALWPEWAVRHRALLIDIARCGDFQSFDSPAAARVAYAVNRLSSLVWSPYAADLRPLAAPLRHAFLFRQLLPMIRQMVGAPDRFEVLWREDWDVLQATERAFTAGHIEQSEDAPADLAIFEIQADSEVPGRRIPSTLRYLGYAAESFHNRTLRGTVLIRKGGGIEIWQRYTGWVERVSQPTRQRRNLAVLAEALNTLEQSGASWNYAGVTEFMPALTLSASAQGPASLDFETVKAITIEFQRLAPPAWSP